MSDIRKLRTEVTLALASGIRIELRRKNISQIALVTGGDEGELEALSDKHFNPCGLATRLPLRGAAPLIYPAFLQLT